MKKLINDRQVKHALDTTHARPATINGDYLQTEFASPVVRSVIVSRARRFEISRYSGRLRSVFKSPMILS